MCAVFHVLCVAKMLRDEDCVYFTDEIDDDDDDRDNFPAAGIGADAGAGARFLFRMIGK